MGEEKFDVIIVGGGLTGCVAARILAQAGLEVLVIERAEQPGSKNVTGGRMYAHSIEKIFPNFGEEAPVERKIVREKISFSLTAFFWRTASTPCWRRDWGLRKSWIPGR